MSNHLRAPAQPVRPSARRLRRGTLCVQAAVAIVLVLSICALLYVLSIDAAKAAVDLN
jgi:hypothetical protein